MKRTSIIIGLLSSALALNSCSSSQEAVAKSPQDVPQPTQTAGHPLTPTPEQQQAARAMLSQTPKTPAQTQPGTRAGKAPATDPDMLNVPELDVLTPDAPGGIPVNLRNLRNPVPPEEAASSRDNDAPAPNAVELRGLRSPSMPKNLPMDINGRQSTGNTQ